MVEEGGTYKLENVMLGFNEGNCKLLRGMTRAVARVKSLVYAKCYL